MAGVLITMGRDFYSEASPIKIQNKYNSDGASWYRDCSTITMEFQPWRDYLQLASLIQMMSRMKTSNLSPVKDDQLKDGKSSDANAEDEGLVYTKKQPNFLNTYAQPYSSTRPEPTTFGADLPANPNLSSSLKAQDSLCLFCKHNGESRHVYTGHNLKDQKGKVTCPILRLYTCSLCGATGESSHTKKYCPLNIKKHSFYKKIGRNCAGHKVIR